MTLEEFETIVNNAVKNIPAEFKDILQKNEIAIIPREEVPQSLKEKFKGGTLFGVFIGVPYGRFVNFHTGPTRIELYKNSFESYYSNQAEIEKQIVKTVVHEVAHYFGFSEAKIRKLGY